MKVTGDVAELFRRMLYTVVAVLGAVLVGTVVLGTVGLVLEASDAATGKPWFGIAVVVLVAAGCVALWRWGLHPSAKVIQTGDEVEIPQPPGDEEKQEEQRRFGSEGWALGENHPSVLKQQFDDALNDARFEDAERILAQIRALGSEDRWCDNSEVLLANRRRRA